MIKGAFGLAGIGVCVLMGCGGGSSASKSSPATSVSPPAATSTAASATPTQTDYKAQYLRLIAPTNQAADTFQAYVTAHMSSITVAQLVSAAAPLATATQQFDDLALRSEWPTAVQPDIKTLVQADAHFIADLQDSSPLTPDAWVTAAGKDSTSASTAANIVRADLGLPPPPTSSASS